MPDSNLLGSASLRQQMEVWFSNVKNRSREANTRAEAAKRLYPRSSRARQESLCPLDKDL